MFLTLIIYQNRFFLLSSSDFYFSDSSLSSSLLFFSLENSVSLSFSITFLSPFSISLPQTAIQPENKGREDDGN